MHHPRKQARQARSRVTQSAILEAAARILERQGQDGLTTNAIAQRAGVSVGSLYQYFPNKEAILASLIRAKRTELLDRMHAALAQANHLDAKDTVKALIYAGMTYQIARPALAQELEHLAPHLSLEPETTALAKKMASLILGTIRQIQPGAGPQEAQDVIAITKGLISAAAQTDQTDAESLGDRACRAVLGYLTFGPDP